MPVDWKPALDAAVQERFDEMVELRRHLHAHPEVSGQERETSLHLYQLLGNQGLDVRMGPDGRGVVADGQPGHESFNGLIALRADIDALRIKDAKNVSYRSQCDGVMHACGHDAHTAVVYGATMALYDLRVAGLLPDNVSFRAIFQPAEETCEGAKEMIAVGALEGVESILAVHMDPTRQTGRVGLRAGVLTANCDEMRIDISGVGGHAARPHEASDPIAAAAQLINALYLYIPRVTDSQDAVVVTIGHISGGEHANVIPEAVHLSGTIRTLDRLVRRRTMEHVCRLASGVGETTQTRISVYFGLGSHSVQNDVELVQLLRTACHEVIGSDAVEEIPRASMGSEDFAFYLDQVPGAMARLGCASQTRGSAPLHTPDFDVDEDSLRFGAQILARALILRAMGEDNHE